MRMPSYIWKSCRKTGLHLFECGFLDSSADGLVISSSREIKCPFQHRNVTIIEMLKLELRSKCSKKDLFLKPDGSLNENHSYWHQVQGGIYATRMFWAEFVVWTSKDIKVIRISKDENIPKLMDFYLNVLLPYFYVNE